MIGVAVKTNEKVIAAEFFELLKTPWEFYRNGCQYDVILCTSENYLIVAPRLLFILSGNSTSFDTDHKVQVNSRCGGFVVSDEGRRLPIYGTLATFPTSRNSLVSEASTQEPAAFASRDKDTTTVRVGYNLFEEARLLLTVGQPPANASAPTLDEHIEMLRDWIARAGIPLVEIPPVPSGYNFIACLTHDIDHPVLRNHLCDHTMFGFLYRSTIATLVNVCNGRKPFGSLLTNWKAACLLPFIHLGIAKDFWNRFDRYLDFENGIGSTFFVIPRSNYAGRTSDGLASPKRACRYNLDELLPQLKRIVSADCEVGVHGLDAWLDAEAGREERESVSQVTGVTELGVRMHWLFFDGNSPALLEEAGFTYDSTIGYRETVGFRAGTTQVYRTPGVKKLLELPLHVMDTSLFYPSYLNLTGEDAERMVWGLMDNAERIGGALTINWHDRSIAPERLWDDFYLKLLHELTSRGAWLPTASRAVAWFRKRRAASVESTQTEKGTFTVRVRMDADDRLPGLRLRIHKPRAQSLVEPRGSRRAAEFVDVPVNDSTELSIST